MSSFPTLPANLSHLLKEIAQYAITTPDQLITMTEAAKLANVSVNTIRGHVKSDKLLTWPVGRFRLVHRGEVMELYGLTTSAIGKKAEAARRAREEDSKAAHERANHSCRTCGLDFGWKELQPVAPARPRRADSRRLKM